MMLAVPYSVRTPAPRTDQPIAPAPQVLRDGAVGLSFQSAAVLPGCSADRPALANEPAPHRGYPLARADHGVKHFCRASSSFPNPTRAALKFAQLANSAFDVFAALFCLSLLIATALSPFVALVLLFFAL